MADAPRAQSAGASMMGRSQEVEEPVNIRFLRTMEAFNSSKPVQPSFSMGAKLPESQFRGKLHTEIGPDISQRLDCALPAVPKWTIKGRWKTDKPTNDWVPAPGSYKNPTTLEKTHPTMPCSGRGWTWGSQERPSMAVSKDGPGPDAYRDDRKNCAMLAEPSWSMIGRPDNPGMKHKGELNFATSKSEPNLLRDTSGMTPKGGIVKTPEYQFLHRPASCLVPAKSMGEIPGPDRYSPQLGGIGAASSPSARIKRSPSYGFGGGPPRFKSNKALAHVL